MPKAKDVVERNEQAIAEAAEVERMAREDAGQGVSSRQEDKFYPLMGVLQKLSPQVDPDNAAYLEGARAGSIHLRNFEPPIVNGNEGVIVQPVYMYEEWVEWGPRERGGGMVSRFLKRPEGARCLDKTKNRWMLGENNLQETRMWVLNMYPHGSAAPITFILPCQSTLNTFARGWMTALGQQFEPGGTVSPLWRYMWKLVTKKRVNPQGEWYTFAAERLERVEDTARYQAGKNLNLVVKKAHEEGKQLAETVAPDADDGAM